MNLKSDLTNIKLQCIYMLKDVENYKIYMYLGKNVNSIHLEYILAAAEIDIYDNPKLFFHCLQQ